MTQPPHDPATPQLTADELSQLDALCLEFESALAADPAADLTIYIDRLQPHLRPRACHELLVVEWHWRRERGETLDLATERARFPDSASAVESAWTEFHNPTARTSRTPSPNPAPNPTPSPDANADADTLDLRRAGQQPVSQAAQLAELLARYQAELSSGVVPDHERWLREHPEFAESLRRAMDGLDFLQTLRAGPAAQPTQLGDFRLLREIGRGGMGAVFEAEQISLGRHVALKVLWLNAVSDPESIRRFQREASTVAQLHHTNIVPIFSVGREANINYYAMQLIDGESLDRTLRSRGGRIEPATVAEWGLQAAEALAHAHQRGVIHRDVKPSNLMLDRHGQIWLTDFGLAKRSDDVTLSMAGAVMGTPRYMSPEQASASTRDVDHRTDIYSLGATLYELVTGRPVYDGQTPHGVISQILTSEPQAPRRVYSAVPRALETILLKCLAKEPHRRYSSARALADDLRSFLDGRPISARPPHLLERSRLWFKRQRRSVSLAVMTALATASLIAGAAVTMYAVRAWRMGSLTVQSSQPGVSAEVTDELDRLALRPITVPTQEPIPLAAGQYTLRARVPGLLSQDYAISLTARSNTSLQLNPELQTVMPPLDNFFEYGLVRQSEDSTDLVAFDAQNLMIRTSDQDHEVRVTLPMESLRTGQSPGMVWPPDRLNAFPQDLIDKCDLRPWIGSQGMDIDRDGRGDILLAMRHQALVAIVSRHRGVIWSVGLSPDVRPSTNATNSAEGTSATGNSGDASNVGAAGAAVVNDGVAVSGMGIRSTIVESPRLCGDLNGDEVSDVLVQLAHVNPSGPLDLTQSVRALVALSGADGAELWRYEVPAELFQMPAAFEVPYEFRWFPGGATSWTDGSSPEPMLAGWLMLRIWRQPMRRTGESICVASCIVRQGADRREALVTTPTHYVRLNLSSGEELEPPQSWGTVVSEPVRAADLNGDGVQELIATEDVVDPPNTTVGSPVGLLPRSAVVAWSVEDRASLWRRQIGVNPAFGVANVADRPRWPIVADLNHDGATELVLPTAIDETTVYWNPTPAWGELEVWDGKTGTTRWTSRVRHADLQLNHLAVGPDVDADGWDEVLVASIWGSQHRPSLFVDCLAGNSGERLWGARWPLAEQPQSVTSQISSLSVWRAGVDGSPTVVASVSTKESTRGTATNLALFSLRTGRLVHVGSDAERIETADLDDDGVEDLVLRHYHRLSQGMRGGTRLTVIRGVAGDTVRRLGEPLQVVADLDGDGVEDLVSSGGGEVVATSSGDGRQLWRFALPDQASSALIAGARSSGSAAGAALTSAAGSARVAASVWDLDRDGTSDLLIHLISTGVPQQPLLAISGRTGRQLWRAPLAKRFQQGQPSLECVDLDGDGSAEVLYYGYSDWGQSIDGAGFVPTDGQLWCAVFRGGTGELVWKVPLTQLYGMVSGTSNLRQVPYRFQDHRGRRVWATDCNADGVLDVLVVGEVESPPEDRRLVRLQAHDGRDGRLLWHRQMLAGSSADSVFREASRIELVDLDGAGSDELVTLEFAAGQPRQARVTARSATDGRTLWTWSRPVADDFELPTSSSPMMAWPRGVRLSDGREAVGLVLRSPERRDVLWLIDGEGSVREEYLLDQQSGESWIAYRLWVGDMDGDGADELLVNNGQLQVLKVGDKLTPLATLPINVSDTMFDVRLREAVVDRSGESSGGVAGGRSGEVMIVRSDRPVVRAFDGRTGRPTWSVMGPDRASIVLNDLVPAVDLVGRDGDMVDRAVLNVEGSFSLCRLASHRGGTDGAVGGVVNGEAGDAAVGAVSGAAGGAVGGAAGGEVRGAVGLESRGVERAIADGVARVVVRGVGLEADPRMKRPLPWSLELNRGDSRRDLVTSLGVISCLSLVLVVVPWWYVSWLWRGRWGLMTWLMLPAVVGLSLVAWSWSVTLPSDLGPLTVSRKYALAAAGAPMWWWAMWLMTLLRRGRWWRVVAWVLSGVALSALIGWIGVMVELDDAPLAAGESLDWSDWYWIGLWGFYIIALLYLALTLLKPPTVWLLTRLHPSRPAHSNLHWARPTGLHD